MTIRERIEREEMRALSQYASKAAQSEGRDKPTNECPLRTAYQRDKDKILHCKAFRRLMHKTQVFISPEGDHYRTRLTHTLEVSQVARTIARALRLNEDLTEAIALGHDLGHTPFGHCGEKALNEISPINFRHSSQSVRVVERIENSGEGLNLTKEVRNGIACHTDGDAYTLEGRVVKFADKIAYLNHDIEDALRAGILTSSDIPWDITYKLGRDKSERITTLISSIVEHSNEDIIMDTETLRAYIQLRNFMFEAVYTNPTAKHEEGKSMTVVKKLYEYYCNNQDKLPKDFLDILEQEGKDRAVCDYISGMSDRFAVKTFQNLFIPRSWSV